MRMRLLRLCLLFIAVAIFATASDSPLEKKVSELFTFLQKEQWKEDEEYWPKHIFPPLKWEKQRGVYSSFVHINTVGGLLETEWRERFSIPDNNGFVTLFVAQLLAEMSELKPALADDFDNLLFESVQAIITYQDKNNARPNTPIFSFWPQTAFDADGATTYRAFPPNLFLPLGMMEHGVIDMEKVAKVLGVKTEMLDVAFGLLSMFTDSFGIPADSDDTGVALAFGATLRRLQKNFPKSESLWFEANTPFNDTFDAYMRYAYQPFADDENLSVVDSRSYFWLRPYLLDLQKQQPSAFQHSLSTTRIISTWMQNIDEVRVWSKRHVAMPFGVNNVDASVCANSLFGILSSVVHIPDVFDSLFDDDVQAMALDTTHLLSYVLNNAVLEVSEPIVLLYYPSRFNFYWFVARTVHMLRAAGDDVLTAYPVLRAIFEELSSAMAGPGTRQLLARVERDESNGYVFWDDFLGDADSRGKKKFAFHQDRVYSTAMAVNALLDSFTTTTTFTSVTASRSWVAETPDEVRSVVSQAVEWLTSGSKPFAMDNAFFSGSVKGDVGPTNFPVNFWELTNGTQYKCGEHMGLDVASQVLIGVSGMMSDEDFEAQRENPCVGGSSFPKTYDLNAAPFPYWSSPALTAAVQMSALVKFDSLDKAMA